jgi:hypothetical protein
MASWIVHLRIADKLLNEISNISSTEFVVGNIAPDSGIPNEDWSVFTPSGNVSHFKTTDFDGLKDIHLNKYVEQFFTAKQRDKYNNKQKSFYIGYLTHLLTDIMWVNVIVRPCKDKYKSLYDKDKTKWIWTIKKDWYDLDFLYIKKNPDFRAFSIYKNAVGFHNDYMDFFSDDAFDNRREYIIGFYSSERDNLDREYTYLKEDEMDRFVEESAEKISQILKEEYL